MELRQLSVERKAYYQFRKGAAASKLLLLGFHGYGRTADEFLDMLNETPIVVSPHIASIQAPNVFYSKQGEVKASWMTSWQREDAIADNVLLCRKVLAELKAELQPEKIALVGFSQGGAMAYRLAAASPAELAALVVIGSDLPPDVRDSDLAALPGTLLLRGRTDSFYTRERLEAEMDRLGRIKNLEIHEYSGAHHPDAECLRLLAGFLEQTSKRLQYTPLL